jgi:hypothetical protein
MNTDMTEQSFDCLPQEQTKDLQPALKELHDVELALAGGGCVTWAFH